ncbi:hypothetical protein [Hymenobacter sp. IS2118]|uniref:hypothetical protein n=1 Tax=Hymenobacter sp. IS2118 TaxID=1505605 RepID=UPI000551171E|nr:hypothetical protein [Hymenobacter sp. IS2118]
MPSFGCGLTLIVGVLIFALGNAQAQSSSSWPVTRLDSVASVSMPYSGSINEELAAEGVVMYRTPVSDNNFDVLIITPKLDQPLMPGEWMVMDTKKVLAQVMKLPDKLFTRPKLQSSYSVTLPSAPNGRAEHQVYSGFDAFHQTDASMELTWVIVGSSLYIFRCSTQLPQEAETAEDMKHFFTTIAFKQPQP